MLTRYFTNRVHVYIRPGILPVQRRRRPDHDLATPARPRRAVGHQSRLRLEGPLLQLSLSRLLIHDWQLP